MVTPCVLRGRHTHAQCCPDVPALDIEEFVHSLVKSSARGAVGSKLNRKVRGAAGMVHTRCVGILVLQSLPPPSPPLLL
jgi:hypothetical protein